MNVHSVKNKHVDYEMPKLEAQANKDRDGGWEMVSYKKKRSKVDTRATLFMAKIPLETKARDVWDFFKGEGKITDIILPRKRDKRGNMIGFIKFGSEMEALRGLERLQHKKLLGRKIDLRIASTKPSGNAKGFKVHENKSFSPFKDEKTVTPHFASVTVKKGKEKESVVANDSTLQSNHSACFTNSLICFSLYPIKGQILHEIFQELKIVGVKIKKMTC